MSIYRNKTRSCYVFEFDRYIGGQRVRATKALPKTWSKAQADAFDRRETDRLAATANGIGPEPDIEAAVACYLKERVPNLKAGDEITRELAVIYPFYRGRPISALADVCSAIVKRSVSLKKVDGELRKLAPATIKKRIRYLTSACRYAWKHLPSMGNHDPAERVVVPEVRNERHNYTDRAGMLRICKACPIRAVRAAIRIAFYTGMRLSEVHCARRGDGVLILEDTKNGQRHVLPVHPKITSAVKVKLFSVSYTSQVFRHARTDAGMPGFHFHDLRHSAASEMINQGIDLYTVGAVLNHKSAASTKRYSHLNDEKLRLAVASIGRKTA